VSAAEHAAPATAAAQRLLAVTALHWGLQRPAAAPALSTPVGICIQIFVRSPEATVASQCSA